MLDFRNYLANLFGVNENIGGIKYSFNDDSIEKSYQAHHRQIEKTKSKVFYVLSILSCIFFIMNTLLTNKFKIHITIYLNLIVMIIETMLFIISFYIKSNSNLFFIIKYTRYFFQCIAKIANIIFPNNDEIDLKVKIIYRVLIFNSISYFYYIDLDKITFALIPSLNTMAIIYVQLYQNFEKYYLLAEILFSISLGIISFFYKKLELIQKKNFFFESYKKDKEIHYMKELIDNSNTNLIILKKDQEIKYMNKTALKFIKEINNERKNTSNLEENEILISDKFK